MSDWTFEYRKGYFHALLDLKNYLDSHSESLKCYRARKYDVVFSILNLLLRNGECMDAMMQTGNINVSIKEEPDKKKHRFTVKWRSGER